MAMKVMKPAKAAAPPKGKKAEKAAAPPKAKKARKAKKLSIDLEYVRNLLAHARLIEGLAILGPEHFSDWSE